ncbi:MAG: hypothetical protein KatS3mg096_061 [Candidatus Parcubacteria bacterium]|nr:MAG: hypothetical protein KatS3mg096_061 [Candidatus Parcubacteria bacterium]
MNKEIIKFIGSEEYDKQVEDIGKSLGFNWGDKEMTKIIILMDGIVKYNLTSENQVKEAIKKWLDFLNEEQINSLYNYLKENFLPKVKELWQKEEIEISEETIPEETFEEKEKKYIEMMKELIKTGELKLPPKRETKQIIEQKPKEEKEEVKIITFEPEEKINLKEKSTQEGTTLPESAIIIKKKGEEEKPKPEDEELLDLSKL